MREQPDVALVDVRMPGGGASAARGIRGCAPDTRVLAFTAHDDRETVLQMLEAGAIGYLLKGDSIDEIVEAIHAGRRRAGAALGRGRRRGHRGARGAAQRRPPGGDPDAAPREADPTRARRGGQPQHGVPADLQPLRAHGRRRGACALSRPAQAWPGALVRRGGKVGLRLELELEAAKAALSALPSLPPDIYLSVNALSEDPPLGGLPQAVARELRSDARRGRGDRARSRSTTTSD